MKPPDQQNPYQTPASMASKRLVSPFPTTMLRPKKAPLWFIMAGYLLAVLYPFVPHILTYIVVVFGFIIASEYQVSKGHGVLLFMIGLIELFFYDIIRLLR